MRRKPIVCLRSVAVVMLLLWTLMLGVNAEEAYTSWDTLNGKVSVYGRHMFEASRRISGTSLGLDFSLKGLDFMARTRFLPRLYKRCLMYGIC